jgi:hypothetical protein
MATDHIRYDLLVQDAFRGIFRKVLTDAAALGLPGEHHFYITFKTHAPGVVLSDRLRAEYPEQMTIILQHQFWDLRVHDSGFEVGLSFRRVPEKLEIPFSAVTGFFDPSVNFGAEFTAEEDANEDEDADAAPAPQKSGPALATLAGSSAAPTKSESPRPAEAAEPAMKAGPRGSGSEPAVVAPASEEKPASDTPKVVSIDAFRKKNT